LRESGIGPRGALVKRNRARFSRAWSPRDGGRLKPRRRRPSV